MHSLDLHGNVQTKQADAGNECIESALPQTAAGPTLAAGRPAAQAWEEMSCTRVKACQSAPPIMGTGHQQTSGL